MSPVTHFLVGWTLANMMELSRKERGAVTIAGVIPDIDALGVIPERLTQQWDIPLLWYSSYHHVLTHNLGFSLVVTGMTFLTTTRRWKTSALAFLSFHLHLLGDMVGSRGPDGYQWPISYLFPFSEAWQWTWQGQWELNAWPNFVITIAALIATLYLAWKRGYSPLEMISSSADRSFVHTLRNRLPQPRGLGQ